MTEQALSLEDQPSEIAELPRKPMGRPTKYNKKILEITNAYIDTYEQHGHKIPSVAGLAVLLKTTRETIAKWCGEEGKEDFSIMVSKLMAAQEQALTCNGLDGTYNSGITKLILSKHGYHDKAEGNQGVTINVTVNRDGDGVTIDGEKG